MGDKLGTKICKACLEEKPITEFYFRKDRNIYRAACKKCKSVTSKEEIQKRLNSGTKVCKHCNLDKPVSEYQKAGGGKWLQPYCKHCDAKRKAKYVSDNKEKVAEKKSLYYKDNKEFITKKTKEYREKNSDKIKVRVKKWADANRPLKRERDKQYRKVNAAKIDAKQKQKRDANPDFYRTKAKILRESMTPEQKAKKREYDRFYKAENKARLYEYIKKNREKIRERNRLYNNKKSATDICFRILKNLRSRTRFALKKWDTIKSDTTVNLLGCSIPEFKQYFSSLFTDNMSWQDFMNGDIHIDHATPCVEFDLSNPEEQKKCFHYTNLQPLWWYDNLKKGTSTEVKNVA